MRWFETWWPAVRSSTEAASERKRWAWLRDARPWLGALIAVGLLLLALRGVDIREVQAAWGRADFRLLAGGTAVVIAGTLIRTLRWAWLFLPQYRPRLRTLLASILASQLVDVVVPFRLGELVRAYYVGESTGNSKVYVLGTAAVERSVDALVVLLLALSLAPLMAFPGWFRWSGLTSTAGFGLLLVVLLLAAHYREALARVAGRVLASVPRLASSALVRRLKPALEALDALQDPRLVLAVWCLSGLAWLCGAMGNYLVLMAMGLNPPFTAALFVLLTLTLGVSLPALPWQVGTYESVAAVSLMAFGVDPAIGIAYGILLHLVTHLPRTVLGAISLRYLESSRQQAAAAEHSEVPSPG